MSPPAWSRRPVSKARGDHRVVWPVVGKRWPEPAALVRGRCKVPVHPTRENPHNDGLPSTGRPLNCTLRRRSSPKIDDGAAPCGPAPPPPPPPRSGQTDAGPVGDRRDAVRSG